MKKTQHLVVTHKDGYGMIESVDRTEKIIDHGGLGTGGRCREAMEPYRKWDRQIPVPVGDYDRSTLGVRTSVF